MTEVQDGDVVRVWPLIHAQIRPQAILQLHNQGMQNSLKKRKKDKTRMNHIMNSESVSFALLANGHYVFLNTLELSSSLSIMQSS